MPRRGGFTRMGRPYHCHEWYGRPIRPCQSRAGSASAALSLYRPSSLATRPVT